MIPLITIPYAVADFAEIRERGFYYVILYVNNTK